MLNAHEVFGDANRKSWRRADKLSPRQIAELEAIAALGVDLSDHDEEE